jgi:hypothetical protein
VSPPSAASEAAARGADMSRAKKTAAASGAVVTIILRAKAGIANRDGDEVRQYRGKPGYCKTVWRLRREHVTLFAELLNFPWIISNKTRTRIHNGT